MEWNAMGKGNEWKWEKGGKKGKGEKKGEVDDIEMYLATLIYLVLTKSEQHNEKKKKQHLKNTFPPSASLLLFQV